MPIEINPTGTLDPSDIITGEVRYHQGECNARILFRVSVGGGTKEMQANFSPNPLTPLGEVFTGAEAQAAVAALLGLGE